MSKHTEVERRRTVMLEDIRLAVAEGRLPQGEKMAPLRDLASKYGVSMNVAWEAIQLLIAERVLHTVPRIGTYVGKPQNEADLYLLTFEFMTGTEGFLGQIQLGFEERIAQLGGMSLCLLQREAREHQIHGQLPPLAGIFRLGDGDYWWQESVASVEFGNLGSAYHRSDKVKFNDLEGGRCAAQHLLGQGHQKIAFLALHNDETGPVRFQWSADREEGWQQALCDAGFSAEGLALHDSMAHLGEHDSGLSHAEQVAVAKRIAVEQIFPRRDITAIIVANLIAADAMIEALSEAGLEEQNWPAILTFDDMPTSGRSVVSYLRLPWDMIGQTAAQLLWERKNGRLTGPPQQRLVSMRLIQRLTCHPQYADGFTALSLGYPSKSQRKKVA